jgi:energy-coupling factor transporter ATP-binding protein EcfA2
VTLEQLGEVETSRAFEATKRFDQLGYFHVPFDQLNGDDHTEAAFTRLVGNAERVAVVGASGCGKSSLIASVLGPLSVNLPDAIVPLRVPVAAEQDDVVIEPGSMARHIVLYATRWASAELFSDEERPFLNRQLLKQRGDQFRAKPARFTLVSRSGLLRLNSHVKCNLLGKTTNREVGLRIQ